MLTPIDEYTRGSCQCGSTGSYVASTSPSPWLIRCSSIGYASTLRKGHTYRWAINHERPGRPTHKVLIRSQTLLGRQLPTCDLVQNIRQASSPA